MLWFLDATARPTKPATGSFCWTLWRIRHPWLRSRSWQRRVAKLLVMYRTLRKSNILHKTQIIDSLSPASQSYVLKVFYNGICKIRYVQWDMHSKKFYIEQIDTKGLNMSWTIHDTAFKQYNINVQVAEYTYHKIKWK